MSLPLLQVDPRIDSSLLDYGSYSHIAATQVGNDVIAVLCSVQATYGIEGVMRAAPSRPVFPAVEPYLAHYVGTGAFDDEVKKFTGRMVRQIVEQLGGRLTRRGVPITVKSKATKGAIYTFLAAGGNNANAAT